MWKMVPLLVLGVMTGALAEGAQATAPQPPTQAGEKTVAELRTLAEQGDARAQYGLGAMYAIGQGVPQDFAQAVAWTRQAAEQGYAEAQFNLGVFYALGRGVPQDSGQALVWYRKAAEQGHQEAQKSLAAMSQAGGGVSQAASDEAVRPPRPMTNADVVALCKAGLSEDVIVNAIGLARASAFDVSTAGLLDLARAGVPNRVIVEMQNPSVALSMPAPAAVSQAPARLSRADIERGSRTAYLVNQSTDQKMFDEVRKRLREWGRWRLVDAREESDVLIVLTEQLKNEGSFGTVIGSMWVSAATNRDMKYLLLVDPLTGDNVVTISSERWATSGGVAGALVDKLRKRLEMAK